MHDIADELDGLKGTKTTAQGGYMPPYRFRQKVVEKVMKKIGYDPDDIPGLCNQGRASELLQEVDRMERVTLLSAVSPSRRALPPALSGTSTRFKDITAESHKQSRPRNDT
jgi:hypothetical protein